MSVETEMAEVDLRAGTYIVRTRQSAGRLVTQLMEPDTEDSLVAWNFFDHSLPSPRAVADPDDPEYLEIVRLPVPVTVESRVVR